MHIPQCTLIVDHYPGPSTHLQKLNQGSRMLMTMHYGICTKGVLLRKFDKHFYLVLHQLFEIYMKIK